MAIEVRNLRFTHPGAEKELLSGLSFRLEKDSFTMLLGANGAGKSTLLHLISGRIKPSSGEVLIDGTGPDKLPPRTRSKKLAIVFQTPENAPGFTVRELAMLGRNPYLSRLGKPGPADREAVWNALEKMELSALADRPWKSLSGGERQRAMIASALAREPDYLLLDEPTSAADPAHRIGVIRILRELPGSPGVLMVTHDISVAKLLGKRILLLREGAVFREGTPEKVMTEENIRAVYGEDAVFLL